MIVLLGMALMAAPTVQAACTLYNVEIVRVYQSPAAANIFMRYAPSTTAQAPSPLLYYGYTTSASLIQAANIAAATCTKVMAIGNAAACPAPTTVGASIGTISYINMGY
jgi:hypothetical protein